MSKIKPEGEKSSFREALPTIVAFMIVALMICFMLVITTYVTTLDTSYDINAERLSKDAASIVSDKIERIKRDAEIALYKHHMDDTYNMEKFREDNNVEAIYAVNGSYVIDEWTNGVFAFSGDEISSLVGNLDDTNVRTIELYSVELTGANANGVAIYIPVDVFEGQTGLIIFYRLDTFMRLTLFGGQMKQDEKLSYGGLIRRNGDVVTEFASSDIINDIPKDIFTFVYNSSMSITDEDALKQLLFDVTDSKGGFTEFSINGEPYTVSVFKAPELTFLQYPDNVKYSDFQTHELFVTMIEKKSDLDSGSQTVYTTFIVYSVAMLIFCLVLTIWSMTLIRRLKDNNVEAMSDAQLGSRSYYRFEREAKGILSSNFYLKYAVIYLDINKFEFIRDNFDPSLSRNVLILVAKLIGKLVRRGETYGHVIDNRFIMLLTYMEEREVIERMKLLNGLVNSNANVRQNKLNLRLNVGIYFIDRKAKYSLQDNISRAIIAQSAPKRRSGDFYAVYDDRMHETYSHEAKIEAIMEYSLKNREFCLFFQPKYSISKDRAANAEVLVRWYNKKKNYYEKPENFIPLFEANGFITELDKFVFVEACRFIYDGMRKGRRIIPLSVNVSRVTAIQPDFTDFYIKTKRQYSIAKNYICLEFTESFAYENYEVVRGIITKLQSEGFLTSIDDFGCGYSSFNMLKEITVDELKLDRFFILKGLDNRKDEILIKTAIQLSKSLGMIVVQEGVENPEDVMRLKEYGCDIIQGYCYSRPIMLSDFVTFLNGDTSYKGVNGISLTDAVAGAKATKVQKIVDEAPKEETNIEDKLTEDDSEKDGKPNG